MKKYFIIILLLSISLVGCSKERNHIKFWHFWSEPSQAKVVRNLIKEFERRYNCQVDVSELSWNDGKTKLIIAFNSRTAPDVLELGSDWIAQFSSAQVLEPIDTTFFKKMNYYDYSLEPAKFNGKLYALPWILGTRVLFCNLDLMRSCGIESPPINITELVNYAQIINDSGLGYGFGCNGSDPHRLYKKILPLIWSLNGKVQDTNNNITIYSNETVRAFEIYYRLSRLGIIETQKQIDLLFVQGKIGFCFSGQWLLELLRKAPHKFNFATCLVPGIDSRTGISFAGGEYLAINKESKNKELSKKLIDFLLSEEAILTLIKEIPEAGFPADTVYLQKYQNNLDQFEKVFAEQLKHSKMTPVHPRWIEIEAIIEKALVEVLYDKKGIYQALKDAQKEIELYNKNIIF